MRRTRPLSLSVALVVLLLAVACADGATTAAAEPLCDGSATARLTFINGGGFVRSDYAFVGAYGSEFFVIDGGCRYWVGAQYLAGIRTGTLSGAAADQIGRRLHRAQFASLGQYGGRGCPDASTRTLSDGVNRVSCTCDCDYQSPPAYIEAFNNLSIVHRELMEGATPASLPMRVLALADEVRTNPAVTWPLAWSPREVLVTPDHRFAPDSGRLVTDAADLTALRTLRAGALGLTPYADGVKVKDEAGDLFLIMPRDQAPAAVEAALAALGPR